MRKHAFLIITHNEFKILQRLVSLIDNDRSDIYVHFDAKVKKLPELKVKCSKLYYINNRVDVRWGHVSQIKCEYALFSEASLRGPYDFYHLISGVHLPLKPIIEVLGYYDNIVGKNVLPYWESNGEFQKLQKVQRYNFFISGFEYGPKWRRRLVQKFWHVSQVLQSKLGIKHYANTDFKHSSNWVSLSEEALQYLLSIQDNAIKKYRYSFCGDEWFVATELYNSRYRESIVSPVDVLKCSIGVANASVYTLDDLQMLRDSNCLWGRKFSEKHMEVVNILFDSTNA